MSAIEIMQGDITRLKTDAIVNAANRTLLGGGGVDGAIHRAAGPELLSECRLLNGCSTGDAKLTKGYRLPAKFVIHTVGPVWRGGSEGEESQLASCYSKCLFIAFENKFQSIAFPCISTGIYGYPKAEAARIAIHTTRLFLDKHDYPLRIIFSCFDSESFSIYKKNLQ